MFLPHPDFGRCSNDDSTEVLRLKIAAFQNAHSAGVVWYTGTCAEDDYYVFFLLALVVFPMEKLYGNIITVVMMCA